MSLEQTLIAEAERECGARLAAIEQAAGLIAEAETLAATLRHHGIADAKAEGFSSALAESAVVRCWVNAHVTSAIPLLQALRDAELRIETLALESSYSLKILVKGLTATISVSRRAEAELMAAMLASGLPRSAAEAAHG